MTNVRRSTSIFMVLIFVVSLLIMQTTTFYASSPSDPIEQDCLFDCDDGENENDGSWSSVPDFPDIDFGKIGEDLKDAIDDLGDKAEKQSLVEALRAGNIAQAITMLHLASDTAQIQADYPNQAKEFAVVLIEHLQQFERPDLKITIQSMAETLAQADVGNRINAITNQVWGNWLAFGDVNGDPAAHKEVTPFRILIIRLLQGQQLQLTNTEIRAIHNYLTRSESLDALQNNMNGVIAAVNREVFAYDFQAETKGSESAGAPDVPESDQFVESNNDAQSAQAESQSERQPALAERPIGQLFAITDFEMFGRWTRGDEAWGTFIESAEQTTSGQYAGKFTYEFPAVANNYVIFRRNITISGWLDALRLQVYGDGSTHFLNVWVQDANNQLWQFTFGRINHTGWQTMWAPLDLSLGWPNQAIGGASTAAPVYPLRFYALVLDGYTSDQPFRGVIFVDDLAAVTFADSPNATYDDTGVATPISASTTATGAGLTTAVVTARTLNVRSGPGANFQIVGKVQQGQVLSVLERDVTTGWVRVETPVGIGWVSSTYVQLTQN